MSSQQPNEVRLQNTAVATGNGTSVDCTGYGTLGLQVVGATFSLTLTWEATVDGSTWVAVLARNMNSGSTATTTTTTGLYTLSVAGYKMFRARVSTYTSGTCDVYGIAVDAGAESPF